MIQRRIARYLPDDSDVHGSNVEYLEYLGERLIDEYDGDEYGECFFGESCDVGNQETQVERHYDEESYHHPNSNPESECHEIHMVLAGKQQCTI